MISDLISPAKGVIHVFPVRASEDERLAIRNDEILNRLEFLVIAGPERPEVDILHAAHVVALIYVQSLEKGLTVKVPDVMTP
jgi:hypothetical protein